jgi:hypothetical protein
MAQTETRRVWASRIADYQSSSLSVSKWCEARKVTRQQFYYWKRKLTSTEGTTPQWFMVNVDPQPAEETEPPLLVKVGSAVIEVKPGFNQALLSDVVRTCKPYVKRNSCGSGLFGVR